MKSSENVDKTPKSNRNSSVKEKKKNKAYPFTKIKKGNYNKKLLSSSELYKELASNFS
jgi:hypothetical protein